MRLPVLASSCSLAAAVALAAGLAGAGPAPGQLLPQPSPTPTATASPTATPSPVQDVACAPAARRCPDLQMATPSELYVETSPAGRKLLRSTNKLLSYGDGAVSLRGTRRGSSRTMTAVQRIRTASGWTSVPSDARLVFKRIPGQGGYWKWERALSFDLHTTDAAQRRVRTSPKVISCLRDLQRTRPGAGSPRKAVFPACDQDPRTRSVTIGTSVGWADVYPAGYFEQYVDVTGLRGCFDLRHVADPRDEVAEDDEANNTATRRVRLPGTSRGVRRC